GHGAEIQPPRSLLLDPLFPPFAPETNILSGHFDFAGFSPDSCYIFPCFPIHISCCIHMNIVSFLAYICFIIVNYYMVRSTFCYILFIICSMMMLTSWHKELYTGGRLVAMFLQLTVIRSSESIFMDAS
ncbi:hypothetical protein ACJX0J_014940, partial [Zea mays]